MDVIFGEWRQLADGYQYEMNSEGDIRSLDGEIVYRYDDYLHESIVLRYERLEFIPDDDGSGRGQMWPVTGVTVFDFMDLDEMRLYHWPETDVWM